MKRCLEYLLFVLAVTFCGLTVADHFQATNLSTNSGSGNGTFNATLTHIPGTDSAHPWYSFCADTGAVNISLNASFSGFLWLYSVGDNFPRLGDTLGTDYTLETDSSSGGTSQNISFFPPSPGTYIVQVDSFIGGDGAYTLSISGATSTPQPGGSCSIGPALSSSAEPVPLFNVQGLMLMIGLLCALGFLQLRRRVA
ncbi:MAG: PPC domain-containing protein [Pseudomonadota bacterium]